MPEEKKCPLINEPCRLDACEWFEEKPRMCIVRAIRTSMRTIAEKAITIEQDLLAAQKRANRF